MAGGSAASGTISTAGLYTAPPTMPSTPSVTITAVNTSSSASDTLTEALQNPVPVVRTGVVMQVGSTLNFTVDVQGSGFVRNSVVDMNGLVQTSAYVSATELQTTTSLSAGATSITVAVSNPAPAAVCSAPTNVPGVCRSDDNAGRTAARANQLRTDGGDPVCEVGRGRRLFSRAVFGTHDAAGDNPDQPSDGAVPGE